MNNAVTRQLKRNWLGQFLFHCAYTAPPDSVTTLGSCCIQFFLEVRLFLKRNTEEVSRLALLAKEHGKYNVAFLCLFMSGKVEECLQVLIDSNLIPEAVLVAISHLPRHLAKLQN